MNWLFAPFRPVWLEIAIAWWTWADREIPRDHDDAHFVHRRLMDLKAQRAPHQTFHLTAERSQ